MAIVYNVMDSGRDSPPGNNSTWKDYWEHHSAKSWPNDCKSGNCNSKASEGAHVAVNPSTRFVGPSGNKMVQIAPFCTGHNLKGTRHGHSVPNDYLCDRGRVGRRA